MAERKPASAEQVIRQQIERSRERYEKAQAEADHHKAEIEKLQAALSAMGAANPQGGRQE
jgi:hypothetical protein